MQGSSELLSLIKDTSKSGSTRIHAWLKMRQIGSIITTHDIRRDVLELTPSQISSCIYKSKTLGMIDMETNALLARAHNMDITVTTRPIYKNGKGRGPKGLTEARTVSGVDASTLADRALDSVIALKALADRGSLSSYSDSDLLEELTRRTQRR